MLSTTTYIYGSSSNFISEKIDHNSDGIVDSITTYDIVFNVYGYGDGQPKDATAFLYYPNGQLKSINYNYNDDTTFDYIISLTYNGNGPLPSSSTDINGDGKPDSSTTYIYNDNGNLTFKSEDNNGDGTNDTVEIYTYDSKGNQTSDS